MKLLLLAASLVFASGTEGETVWDRMMKVQSGRLVAEGAEQLAAGAYKTAADTFAKAVVSNPEDPTARMLLGVAYYWSGDVPRAMTEYQEALKRSPKDGQIHQLIGIAHAWKGDIESARASFEEAAKLAPNRADVQMNLGSVLEGLGDLSNALVRFRRAAELAPTHPLYQHQLGVLYARLGRDDEARQAFKESMDLYSRYQDSMLELAALEERNGRLKEAAELFGKAVKNKPGDAVARFRYAAVLWKSGRKDEARQALGGAFRVSPPDKGGRLALSTAYGGKPAAAPGGGAPPEPATNDPVESLKRNLRRLPLDRTAAVEVQLLYMPRPELKKADRPESPGAKTGSSLQRALAPAAAVSAQNPIAAKRQFTLRGDKAQRERQIEAVASDLRASLEGRPPGQVHIGLNVQYQDPMDPDPRLSYQPRPEENELGLWVVGTTWVELVKEGLEGLPEDARLVRGTGLLTVGDASDAEREFDAAAEAAPKDPLPRLGIAVARVAAGRETEAGEAFREVLKLDPKNDAAQDALKWLQR